MTLLLRPGQLSLAELRRVWHGGVTLALDPAAQPGIAASLATVERVLAEGRTAYGVNTGFGKLAQTHIAATDLAKLQRNLLLSHAAGTGPLLDDAVVRLVLALKAASLARGHSGVRPATIEALIALHNAGALPCVPSQGSVGASGDLAPLAHLCAVLIGVGEVRIDGRQDGAAAGLAKAGLRPLELGPKEGLALINGTQVSTALALAALFRAETVFSSALLGGAMSVDAVKGSDVPFDPRIHALRGQPGQIETAAAYLRLLAGSAIRHSHIDCGRVQDPYSLRCQPQVMGAALDLMRQAARMLAIEANAVTDNPLVFAATGDILSGGNFHAEPVAMAADMLAIAVAEVGALSERRIALLTDPALSGLPAFLVREGGLNSGFMIAHVTAASLASENKSLAHPASVDSLPTSANQEDHVSMATFAARRLLPLTENVATIVAIELLAAAQGIEFHRPLESSTAIETAIAVLRRHVAPYVADRYFAPDIAAAKALVLDGRFAGKAGIALPSA